MDLVIFEENKPFVLEALRNGEFDYMEAASEVFEADFFRFIKAPAILCEKDSYLLELSAYIHLNPVRANLVKDPAEYPWSSYREYLKGGSSGLVDGIHLYLKSCPHLPPQTSIVSELQLDENSS
jgi:hypothetical protein